MVPRVNNVSYVSGAGGGIYAWPTNTSTRQLTYSVALYLSSGDTFGLYASGSDNIALGQQFSAHYVGDAVTGFSVRYNGTHPFSIGQSLFANSAAGRTTVYSQGGGYTENGYTAPLTGAYQVRQAERRRYERLPLHAPPMPVIWRREGLYMLAHPWLLPRVNAAHPSPPPLCLSPA